jgi:hypothetical protein
LLDPLLYPIARRGRDLELYGALSLVLHHDSASGDLIAMADVSYPQGDEVTATELAVYPEVEESKLARQTLHLHAHSECAQMSLSLNGAFCPTILPLFHGWR